MSEPNKPAADAFEDALAEYAQSETNPADIPNEKLSLVVRSQMAREVERIEKSARWAREWTLREDERVTALVEALDSCESRLIYFETLPDSEAYREHARIGREKATEALKRWREET